MKKTFRFEKREHEDYGFTGWLMVGAPSTYYPLAGMGIAHDLLEHFPDDNGSVEDELMALGASLWVRGEGGYWAQYTRNQYSPGANLSPDLCMLGTQFEGCYNGIQSAGRTTRLEEHVELWIDEALRESRSELIDQDVSARESKAFLASCRGWLRKGYRAAAKRYSKHSAGEVAYLFHLIQEEADRLLQRADPDFEPMVVEVDFGRCDFKAYLDEVVDDWG